MAPHNATPTTKYRSVTFAAVSTFLSLIPTAYVAFASNSAVLLADFIRCAVEFAAIFLSWLVVRRMMRSDSSYYDYGFGKWEQLASLAVAVAMLVSFLLVLLVALNRLYEPARVENVLVGFVFSLLSVGGNLALWLHNRFISKRESSPILESQARLFRAKAIASLVVVASLGLSMAPNFEWFMYADPLGACIVAGFLLHSALVLFSSSMQDLLDRSIEEARRLAILHILVKHESRYEGLVSLRARRSGVQTYVDIELEFSGDKKLSEVTSICDQISADISAGISKSQVNIRPRAR